MDMEFTVDVTKPRPAQEHRSNTAMGTHVRTGSGRTLPAIKAVVYEDPNEAWGSPRATSRNETRLHHLEDRLANQEKTTQSLLDRAYRIKEDIIDNLNITHGTWQEEKQARSLLQDHIRTITEVVKKLSRDIGQLEGQVHHREGAIVGTNDNVKNLEMHHVAGITDLRGRIARCDAGISRVVQDVRGCNDSIKVIGSQQTETTSRMADKIAVLESKVAQLLGQLNQTNAQHEIELRHLEGDSSAQLTGLESKTRSMVEEANQRMNTYRLMESNEREKLEAKLNHTTDKYFGDINVRVERLEKEILENVGSLHQQVGRLSDELEREKLRSREAEAKFEQKINSLVSSQLRKQTDDLARLKKECREGFGTVHESISNMKSVMDGKRRLLEEQLRKELGQIRKMVVLI